MAKAKTVENVEIESVEVKPVCVVSDQQGNQVKVFDNATEAYAFASENAYQVNIS